MPIVIYWALTLLNANPYRKEDKRGDVQTEYFRE